MQRFATMMRDGLTAAGVAVELIQPQPWLGRFRYAGNGVAKWLGYVDKFVFFAPTLQRKLARRPALVHICDHSNAMYARQIRDVPVVVTCHDLLAVRGALGEETDTPVSLTGKLLQRWIMAGLEKAAAIACISHATLADVERLVPRKGSTTLEVITQGLNYPYRRLPVEEARARLRAIEGLGSNIEFALHVGSNADRKNRAGVLRIFARCRPRWSGSLVFAGEPLSAALRSLSRDLGISDRIVEVPAPSSAMLEALYSGATALLFPSTFEGFGWPIAEAQACGCPVLCSDREPMAEVAGAAGLTHPLENEEAFAEDLLRLTDGSERERWSEKSLRNAERFSTEKMIARYVAIYRRLATPL